MHVKDNSLNRTAVFTAMFRAAHLLMDAEPKLLLDDLARDFAGFDDDENLLKAFRKRPLEMQDSRALFVLRNRYAEDELAEAVARGVSQYVILGAGLDSFAFRPFKAQESLEIFEVDHPATQASKLRRIADLHLPIAPNHHFVPMNIQDDSLAVHLERAGFQKRDPAFFSCLGVTQYLERPVVLKMLREVAQVSAPGSELVLQFQVPLETLNGDDKVLLERFRDSAASTGAPWLTCFEPDEIAYELKNLGFTEVTHFGAKQATERYLDGRTDGLTLPSYFEMIKGRVS